MAYYNHLHKLNAFWLQYEYKHTTLVLVSIALFVIFLDSALITGMLEFIQHLDYFAAFIAGVLMVSFFTVAPAVVLLVALIETQGLNPLPVALIAGFGSMFGDWLLLLSFKEHIFDELRPIFVKMRLDKLARRLRHRYTSWLFFVLGGVIIATPLPDEIGIAMLGISHFKPKTILLLCFVLNALGIYVLARAVQIL